MYGIKHHQEADGPFHPGPVKETTTTRLCEIFQTIPLLLSVKITKSEEITFLYFSSMEEKRKKCTKFLKNKDIFLRESGSLD